MAPSGTKTAVVNGSLGHWWSVVRGALVLAAAGCVAGAVVLHPAIAVRFLSSDGNLAASSQQALYTIAAVLATAAAAALLVWRRWQTPTARRERIVLGVTSIVASLLISALTAEAGLSFIHRFVRPLGAERHYFFEHDPVLGWKHRPRSVATFKSALVRIDEDGLRVTGLERGPFRSRVLLLGDSQAFGDGVAAEDTFASRLEAEIAGLRVLNASVIGYGTDQQLLYFEQQARRLRPDATVVALNAYDLRDNLSTRVRSGYAKPRFVLASGGLTLTNVPVPGDGPIDRLQRELQHRSHLYRLAGRFRRSVRESRDEEAVPAARRPAVDVYPDAGQMERGLTVTAAILDRLADSARSAGTGLIVVFLPYQMDFVDSGTYAAHTGRLVKLLEQRAAAGRFTFLDARAGLAADRPETLFVDAMHLSPAGHGRVAALLRNVLAPEREEPISRTSHEY